MSGMGKLTAWDNLDLQYSASVGVKFLIEHHDEIERVAERFANNDIGTAMADILDKGLAEYLVLCDLDDQMNVTETRMQDPANGIVTSFSGTLRRNY